MYTFKAKLGDKIFTGTVDGEACKAYDRMYALCEDFFDGADWRLEYFSKA